MRKRTGAHFWVAGGVALLLVAAAPALAQRRGGGGGGGFRGGSGGFRGGSGGFHGGIRSGFAGGYHGGGRITVGGGYRGGYRGGHFGGYARPGIYRSYNRPYYRSYYSYPRFAFGLGLGFGYWPSYNYWPYYAPYYSPYYYDYYDSSPYYYAPSAPLVMDRQVIQERYRDDAPPPAAAPAPQPVERYWLIGFRDKTIRAVSDYWLEGSTLHYVTRDGNTSSVNLSEVDLPFTQELNRDRGLDFRLPRSDSSQPQVLRRDSFGRRY